jgi:hypothetical protein
MIQCSPDFIFIYNVTNAVQSLVALVFRFCLGPRAQLFLSLTQGSRYKPYKAACLPDSGLCLIRIGRECPNSQIVTSKELSKTIEG